MSRIRTIQPTFARSRSMSRISREARLLFVLLWTVVDDEGRAFAAPPDLAALLYASDPDVPMFLPAWLDELEREECIERYTINDVAYLRIVRWHKYQQIDHPTPSRFPPSPGERPVDSRLREASRKRRRKRPETPPLQGPDVVATIREKKTDEGVRELTPAEVIAELHGILQDSRARGTNASAIRAVELMGKRLNLWQGRAAPAGGSPDEDHPPLTDIVP